MSNHVVSPRCAKVRIRSILSAAVAPITVLAGPVLVALAPTAYADTMPVWTGATPGDWQIGTNWSTGNVPVIGDTVTLGNAASGSIFDGTGANMFVSQINFTGTNALTITANSGLQDFIIGPGAATEGINVASNAGALTISSPTSNVDFNINGTSAAFVNNSTVNTLNFTNAGMFISAGTSSCVLTIDGPGNQTYNGYFGNYLSGTTTVNTFGMIKNGSGTLLLNGNPSGGNANYWTGGFTINAGVVGIGGGNSVSGGTGGNTLYLNGGTLYLNANSSKTIPKTDNTVIGGNFSFGLTNPGTATGNLTFNGPIDLGNAAYTLTFNGAGTTFFAGGVTDGSLIKSGTATLSFSNTEALYSGSTVINQGVLAGTNTANVLSPNSDFTINGGTLLLSTFAQHIGSLAGTGVVNLGASGSLYTGNDGTSTTFAGTIIGTGTNPSVTAIVKEGSGVFNLTSTNGSTFYGSTFVNGGVVGALQDNDLGNSANAVTINAATFQANGTFTSARTFNLGDATQSTIDVTAGNTLTLTSALGGSGNLTMGTSGGTLDLMQSSSITLPSVNVNGGTLAFDGTAGLANPLTISGTLTVNGGGKAALISNPSGGVTNSVSTLTINGSGQLDLANHTLVTNTDPGTIRQYLIAGANIVGTNPAAWNGTGGISSVNAAASTNHLTALGYSSGTHSALGIALGLNSGQTVVKYTIMGDANLDGSVDISDLDIVLSNYASGKPPTWDTGDFTYAGQTDITDLNIVLSNYAKTAPTSVATPSVARPSVKAASGPQTLTGTVSPAVASGAIELDVNTITGDAVLNPNNVKVVSLQVASSSGNLIPNNWQDLSFYYGTTHWADSSFQTINLAEYDTAYTSRHDSLTLTAPVDYGDIFNTSGPHDLTFEYGIPDADGSDVDTEVGAVVYSSGVPEPTTLGLMGLAMAGLMGRRRKRGV